MILAYQTRVGCDIVQRLHHRICPATEDEAGIELTSRVKNNYVELKTVIRREPS